MSLAVIQNKIYEIRGQKVMLDFDLAELYDVKTKRLNEQVKRNLERFSQDFMFRLTLEEWYHNWSQNATGYNSENTDSSQIVTTSNNSAGMQSQIATASQKKRNTTATPFAFTEHGVTMLASILRSEKAVKMNIAIVRAFIALRQLVIKNKNISFQLAELRQELSQRIDEHDIQLHAIYDAIENLPDQKKKKKIGKTEIESALRKMFKTFFYKSFTLRHAQKNIITWQWRTW